MGYFPSRHTVSSSTLCGGNSHYILRVTASNLMSKSCPLSVHLLQWNLPWETTCLEDHKLFQKIPYFNATEPVTNDHLSDGPCNYIFMANGGSLSRQVYYCTSASVSDLPELPIVIKRQPDLLPVSLTDLIPLSRTEITANKGGTCTVQLKQITFCGSTNSERQLVLTLRHC